MGEGTWKHKSIFLLMGGGPQTLHYGKSCLFSQEKLNIGNVLLLFKRVFLFYSHDS